MSTRIVVVAGAPGAGKGTQCKMLAQKYGLMHLALGDEIREEIRRGTPLGQRLAPYLESRRFLPDEMVKDFIIHRVTSPEGQARGVLLDGFPRTVAQARMLSEDPRLCVERFLLLQCPDSVCAERMVNRRQDPTTGELYNLSTKPPPSPEIADRLIRREMDADPEHVQVRLRAWYMRLGLILPFFRGKIMAVNGGRSIEEVTHSLEECMERDMTELHRAEEEARREEARRAETAAATAAEQDGPTAPPPGPGRCTVCMDALAEFLCIPCGHQCGCEGCLQRVQSSSGRCPICRTQMTGIVKVFRAGQAEETEEEARVERERRRVQAETQAREAAATNALAQGGRTEEGGGWGDDAEGEGGGDTGDGWDDEEGGDGSGESGLLKVKVMPCEEMRGGAVVPLCVRVEVSDLHERQGVDVCCVVDISGSMCSMASYQDENDPNQTRDDGLTILDLVKHAVRSVMHTLTETDRLSVVAFDNRAETCFPLTEMTTAGRNQAIEALNKLEPRNQTNIWGGLHLGLENLRDPPEAAGGGGQRSTSAKRKRVVLLLTDGIPTTSPPNGHFAELQKYKDSHPEFEFQVNTFSFGYSLKSEILMELATGGGGTFAFIPDAKILGTCFVDAVANACSTLCQSSQIHLIAKNGASFGDETVLGDYVVEEATWGRVVKFGPLTFGQSRDLVVKVRLPAEAQEAGVFLEAIADCMNTRGEGIRATGSVRIGDGVCVDAVVGLMRCEMVTTGFRVIGLASSNKGRQANQEWAALTGRLEERLAVAGGDVRLVAMKEDVSGRMAKSLNTRQRFERWGRHYLRALVRSHQLQQSTNFMDPGLKVYGGSLFKHLREIGGKIFVELPPPTPSVDSTLTLREAMERAARGQYGQQQQQQQRRSPGRQRNRNRGGGSRGNTGAAAAAPPRDPSPDPPSPPSRTVDMSEYYDAGGGCFGPDSLVVRLEKGVSASVPLRQVRKGDVVKVAGGPSEWAEVVCVVLIPLSGERQRRLVPLPGGLVISPKHPVREKGTAEWIRPVDAMREDRNSEGDSNKEERSPPLTDFLLMPVLDRTHVLEVNGWECVTWGHGLSGPVVHHPFYGTSDCVESLRRPQGWEGGFVSLSGVRRMRDSNGSACGFVLESSGCTASSSFSQFCVKGEETEVKTSLGRDGLTIV
uniref:RING-type domain-containing protein n=1 Tax=Chromera velia CCMP2878 TaxID=1169474 RepID=A0A0G4I825_9ALVE|eukprot:Cvel_11812.t1-p1 / transcript=Cvel_11812.t1 / gene=Cvel_11812 / organism=Chromera_velia_CCMP2878 / gene_product=Adenylate kinase, chloroplastic, putative / transcript_product=Adenylate kinase, chloroplastic, putative / location=Cvel_scaffold752:563-7123(+) / protein_length=1154 / sequence_SO=supercontig / SO=protein_coding / is_pseudo=false